MLGKLGGRNRRFLHDPLELDLKENPEHGLRLILTFQPTTSFLVPLDRCLALSSQNLLSNSGTACLCQCKHIGPDWQCPHFLPTPRLKGNSEYDTCRFY